MSKLLSSPKALAALVVVAIVFVVSLAGGALGNAFGGGFLGAPLATIQLPAEAITEKPPFLGFTITNTMITTWATIVVLLVVSFFATRRMNEVPSGLQNFIEVIIEFFLNLCESVAGHEKARRFFPLVMTIFVFVVTANWMGILPGFGTIGRVETLDEIRHHAEDKGDHLELEKVNLQVFNGNGTVAILFPGSIDDVITGQELDENKEAELKRSGKQAGVLVPFLRSANTDVNTTLGIALVAMFMVHFWGFSALGFLGHVGKFINIKGGPIGLFVGILDLISEVARIISFTFRLFGNIFAGEVLLVALAFLLPLIGIIPFLGLELFVGVIQAFIFSMLTLVFASMATLSHDVGEH